MNLRIGIPSKGRLAELAAELLVDAGLKFRRQERSLFARVRDMPIDVTFLRTDDIPVLCAEGAIDLGITGSDLVEESGVELDDAARARPRQLPARVLRSRRKQHPEARRPRRLADRHELPARHRALPRHATKSKATSSSSPARWK